MSDGLRDIKPLVDISDYSLMLLILTMLFGLFIGYKLFKVAFKYALSNCKVDCQKYYFYMYSNIDWTNPKEAAYLATKYGAVLAKDKRRKELFRQLRAKLDEYKYKKVIDAVDSETLNYYNLYKQVCDESL